MKMLIRDVQIIDAERTGRGQVLVEDGVITEVRAGGPKGVKEGSRLVRLGEEQEGVRVINGKGLTLMPAFIDLHTHLRDPGYPEKEDLQSGQEAALKGGYTVLCAMANTSPVCDNRETMAYIQKKAAGLGLCEIRQVSALTRGLQGEELVDLDELLQVTNLFSDDGFTVQEEALMAEALKRSAEQGFTVMTHCQPETEIVARDLKLLSRIGGRMHICHVSRAASLELIKLYKAKGLDFTCEVTPHHLFASGLDYRVNPPFRAKEDVAALLEGIRSGLVDVIATDHAPHTEQDKLEGAPGISSIEAAFSLVYTIFQEQGMDLQLLSRLMSYQPARILGLRSGLIREGYRADLVLIDPGVKFRLNPDSFISRGRNNPFSGAGLQGRVILTIKEGQILYQESGEIEMGWEL